jgi:predicted AlkP superfamily pyrophosphatase or phosphodiesterase
MAANCTKPRSHGVWIFFALLAWITPMLGANRSVEHVVVVGVDGLSPDGVQHAAAPVMKGLCRDGAWTFHARCVMPTSSSPNWASMIMGAGPEQHGITSNDWELNKFDIAPTVAGPSGRFPSVFTLLQQQQPRAFVAVFHDWGGFGRLIEPTAANILEHSLGPTNAIRDAITCLKQNRPRLTFLQLDHVDHAGHAYGHGTAEYYASVDVADKLIGELVRALDETGMRKKTVMLVTSDHGGKGKGHGGATMGELEIPWILAGPGVRVGHEILAPMNTYDTAATLAWLLGIKPPSAWIAHPVGEAFVGGAK